MSIFNNFKNPNYNNKIIIAGPCSIESYDQTIQTFDNLRKNKISFFRAGVWKPRTKPGGFEGLGEIALQWIEKYKSYWNNISFCCEVANREQTLLALKHGIDAVWIGARTTSNPFLVQEIADTIALTQRDLPVFIKNPTCVDIDLWEGAYLRFMNCGVTNLAFVHRGFKAYKETNYRNNPLWRYALQIHMKYPEVPMICDPSHIAGDSKYIREICQKANLYGYDGFMIESHYDPTIAWTDAKQQITPNELGQLLKELGNDMKNENEILLENYRKDVDSIDMQILELLRSRFEVTNRIGEFKRKNNIQVFQGNRFMELVNNLKQLNKIPESLIDEIWGSIHEESVREQNEIFMKKDEKTT